MTRTVQSLIARLDLIHTCTTCEPMLHCMRGNLAASCITLHVPQLHENPHLSSLISISTSWNAHLAAFPMWPGNPNEEWVEALVLPRDLALPLGPPCTLVFTTARILTLVDES